MRLLLAAMAFTTVSTPAFAMESYASSRAIPPVELVQAVASAPVVRMTDLVARSVPDAGTIREAVIRQAPVAPAVSTDERQKTCIAQAVYYESKGEPMRGQRAVADVIVNRTKRAGYASTPCGVIHQPHQFTNASRWSIPSSGDPLWQRARDVAARALAGIDSVSAAITQFHAVSINPGWGMRRFAVIGGHVFY